MTLLIRTPHEETALGVDSSRTSLLLGADYHVNEVYISHAHLLRSSEDTELASAPNYELVLLCNCSREATSKDLSYSVRLKLGQSDWQEESLRLRRVLVA